MSLLLTIAAFCSLFGMLLAAAICDIRTRTIPNGIVIAIMSVWAIWQVALFAIQGPDVLGRALDSLIQAFVFSLLLLMFVSVVEAIQGKPAMGGGDIKLLAAAVLFLGIRNMLVAIFVASAVSLLYAASNRITHSGRGIPFAPCILAGALIVLMF